MKGIAIKLDFLDCTEMELTIRIGLPIDPHSVVAEVERQEIIDKYTKLMGSWVEIKEINDEAKK